MKPSERVAHIYEVAIKAITRAGLAAHKRKTRKGEKTLPLSKHVEVQKKSEPTMQPAWHRSIRKASDRAYKKKWGKDGKYMGIGMEYTPKHKRTSGLRGFDKTKTGKSMQADHTEIVSKLSTLKEGLEKGLISEEQFITWAKPLLQYLSEGSLGLAKTNRMRKSLSKKIPKSHKEVDEPTPEKLALSNGILDREFKRGKKKNAKK